MKITATNGIVITKLQVKSSPTITPTPRRIYLFTLRSRVEMMQMIIRHQPDDVQVFESNNKTVMRTTVFDLSILGPVFQPLWGVSTSEDSIITTAQQTTPLSFSTILNRSDSSCVPRITLAVVHAITRNRHCRLQLLKIAF